MRSRILFLLALLAISLTVSVGFFWFYEHGVNPNVTNLFDAVWWWVVTSATVGYGDIVPVTWQGRVVGIGIILTGFLIYTGFVAIIMESVHAYFERRERGIAQITARHHIVLCEYTAVADELIQDLPSVPGFKDRPVVIVSDLVTRNPYPQHQYVCGVPINPASLRLANVAHADYVFIFTNLRFADPDIKTLHTASRVRDLNPTAVIFVEMVDPTNELLRYAGGTIIPLDSRKLMEAILRRQPLDPNEWLRSKI